MPGGTPIEEQRRHPRGTYSSVVGDYHILDQRQLFSYHRSTHTFLSAGHSGWGEKWSSGSSSKRLECLGQEIGRTRKFLLLADRSYIPGSRLRTPLP